MFYHNPFGWQNTNFSRALKSIIILSAMFSILTALFNSLNVNQVYGYPIEELFGISLSGIKNYFLWQPLSYTFIQYGYTPLSLTTLIFLFLNLFTLGIIGNKVVEHIGESAFVKLFFSSGVIAAIAMLGVVQVTNVDVPFVGNTAPVYTLLMVWCMLYPLAEVHFLPSFKVKVKSIFATIIAVQFLLTCASLNFVYLSMMVTGLGVGYLYGLGALHLTSPFLILRAPESIALRVFDNLNRIQIMRSKKENPVTSRVNKFPLITSSQALASVSVVLDDEEFMDIVLEKISRHGQECLTWTELQRMKQISMRIQQQRESMG